MNAPMLTEPTALERQRIAFGYLREHAINAHVAGDGLLANLLSHSGLDRATRMTADGVFLLGVTEIAWMPVLALYWLVNPSSRYAVSHSLEKIMPTDDGDAALLEWLKLYHCLVEQPLLNDAPLFARISSLQWPTFFSVHSPEAEALITHIIELAWFRAPGRDEWRTTVESWRPRAPEWTRTFIAAVVERLTAQTRLTYPSKLVPIYPESAAETLRSSSPFAELWLLHLHGRSTEVCSTIERLTPRISPDSHDWRVLGDFMHFDGTFVGRDESQNVHLARRRRLSADTPLLIFHDSREQRIDDASIELFRARSESMAAPRWEILTLAMLHELSALRLWDYGMWIQAIRSQAETTLESMQWTNASPALSAHGLVLAVRSFAARDPNKDYLIRRSIDVLEFAGQDVLEQLADNLLATYPRQKHSAAALLGDLTDLLPPSAWPELARWTVSYARESADHRTDGWSMAPASHWSRALPAIAIDSPVWNILHPEALAIAGISFCWRGEEARFLEYWMNFAPTSLARDVAVVMADHAETNPSLCLARSGLLIKFERAHPELHGLLTRPLLGRAHSASEAALLADHLGEADIHVRKTALRERMRELIADTITRATPSPDANKHTFGMAEGIHLIEEWLPEDEPLLKKLIAAVDSPNVLSDYLPWLIQTIQLVVANGPPEFARIAEPAVGRWTKKMPTGRTMFGQQAGPFATMHFGSDQPEETALMLGWLVFQLPRKLGTDAHENVLSWVRHMLLSQGVRPLQMAIYGSAVVALQADEKNVIAEALSLFETATISLWTRSFDNVEAGVNLASALRRLSMVIGSESSDLLPNRAEVIDRAKRLTLGLAQFLPHFVRSPRASIRGAVAALLWQLENLGGQPALLSELLETLKKDNRALVRFEAHGGWPARKKAASQRRAPRKAPRKQQPRKNRRKG